MANDSLNIDDIIHNQANIYIYDTKKILFYRNLYKNNHEILLIMFMQYVRD